MTTERRKEIEAILLAEMLEGWSKKDIADDLISRMTDDELEEYAHEN